MSAAAREAVLARVRASVRDAAPGAVVPPPPGVAAEDRCARFVERVRDYRAGVARCADDDAAIAVAVAAALDRHGAASVVVAGGVPAPWRPPGAVDDDPPLSAAALAGLDAVLTGAAAGIAETGTLVLDGSPACGRRAITLVPDVHVCVVRAAVVLDDVPDAMRALAGPVGDGRPITFVSGPSATSDIELQRVEGVHGPRRLEVVLAG